MPITTAQYKAAVEAKIAAATGSTSLDDLTLIKSNADLWLQNNSGGSITGYATLESLIQTKQNALTGSSTLDDITLTGVSAFPPVVSSAIKSIQRGSNSANNTTTNVTISAVNMNKAIVLVSWAASGTSSSGCAAKLTTSTNLQIQFGGTAGSVGMTAEWQVIEYV